MPPSSPSPLQICCRPLQRSLMPPDFTEQDTTDALYDVMAALQVGAGGWEAALRVGGDG